MARSGSRWTDIPQAVTPAKRNAQGKVVAMLRETKKEEKLG